MRAPLPSVTRQRIEMRASRERCHYSARRRQVQLAQFGQGQLINEIATGRLREGFLESRWWAR
jgi:hypothetical protein